VHELRGELHWLPEARPFRESLVNPWKISISLDHLLCQIWSLYLVRDKKNLDLAPHFLGFWVAADPMQSFHRIYVDEKLSMNAMPKPVALCQTVQAWIIVNGKILDHGGPVMLVRVCLIPKNPPLLQMFCQPHLVSKSKGVWVFGIVDQQCVTSHW